jgi:enoyl-CoA hydratase/carnithine racemase
MDIAYAVDNHIATITLARPEALNALTREMVVDLVNSFDQADEDDDVRAVVVTGAGRAFCAGADISGGPTAFTPQQGEDVPRDGGGIVALRILDMRKPVIAAINGVAVGVGVTMTLPMDVRLCSESARFGFVFVRRGIAPEAASSWFLPRIVGISRAMEWAATGRVFPAAEALAGGLVSKVHPDAELLPAAYALAREIADNASPVAVAATRHMMWSMLSAPSPWDAHRMDSLVIHQLARSPDTAEGVASFLEKRPARFTSRVSTDMPRFSTEDE